MKKWRWFQWLGLAVAALVLVCAVVVVRTLRQRAEHHRLREAEVGRPPVAAPKRPQLLLEPSRPSDAGSCLFGQVLHHGVPLAEMQVSVSSSFDAHQHRDVVCRDWNCAEGIAHLLESPRLGLAMPSLSVVSAEDGTFTLCGLTPASVELVWGEHEDGRVALPSEDFAATKSGWWIPLEVADLVDVHGVVQEQGRRVPGARVFAWPRPGVFFRETTTDAQGRFAMRLLPGMRHRFLVAPKDRRPMSFERDTEIGKVVVLELVEPFALKVRALSAGQPVEGAQVTVGSEPPRLTNARGEVDFKSLPGGERLAIKARHRDLLANGRVNALPGATQVLELDLKPGIRVRGSVIDEKGQPRIGRVRGLTESFLETDANGNFESDVLNAFDTISPQGLVEGCESESGQSREIVESITLLLKVRCEVSVEGTVVDAEGAPIANASVALKSPKSFEIVSTDSAGHFELHQLPGTYHLEVSHERYRSTERPLTVPAKEVTVVLDAGGSISGRVVDGKGKPVIGAEVAAVPALFEEVLKEVEGRKSHSNTDGEGQFTLPHLLAGRWLVWVTGPSVPTTTSEPVALQPGQHLTGVVVTVEGSADFSGTVVDEHHQPIPAARVSWEPADDKALLTVLFDAVQGHVERALRMAASPTHTDEDGHFELKGVPVSQVKLLVTAAGFEGKQLEAAKGARIEVILERNHGRVKGRVLDEKGRPLARFVINGSDFTSSDGRFEIEANGRESVLMISAPDFVSVTKTTTVDTHEKDVGDVTLPRGRVQRVKIVTADAKPVEGVRVVASQSVAAGTCTTRFDGACVLGPLLDEDFTIDASKAGFESVERFFEKTRLTEPLELTLKPAGGRVEGNVLNATRQPVAARSVVLSARSFTEFALTDERGHFEIGGLPEGPLCASVELSGLLGTEWAMPVLVTAATPPIALGPHGAGGTVQINSKFPGRVLMAFGEHPPQRAFELEAKAWCAEKRALVVSSVVTGSAVFEGLQPGRWSVYLLSIADSNTDLPISPKVLEVRGGESQTVP